MFRFKKLDVWHRAVEFADYVYDASAGFPSDERFGLTSQMRRAAVSISFNIAEGSSRSTDRDFARFVEIAYGSLLEVVSQACVATRRNFLSDDKLRHIENAAEELARILSGLRARLKD